MLGKITRARACHLFTRHWHRCYRMTQCTCWFVSLGSRHEKNVLHCAQTPTQTEKKEKKEKHWQRHRQQQNTKIMIICSCHTTAASPIPAESVEPIYNGVDARDTSLLQSIAVYQFRYMLALEVSTYITVISSFVYSLSPSQTRSHPFSAPASPPPRNIIFYYELLASNEYHYNALSRRRAHFNSYVSWRIRIGSISSHDVISKPKEHHQHRIM